MSRIDITTIHKCNSGKITLYPQFPVVTGRESTAKVEGKQSTVAVTVSEKEKGENATLQILTPHSVHKVNRVLFAVMCQD